MESEKCCCDSAVVGLFPCSGGSNVGQISNRVAVELTQDGTGVMMCTAGIGGKVAGLIRSAEGADMVIAIDGCPLNCSRKSLENAGIQVDKHILITDLGVSKNKDLKLPESTVIEVTAKVRSSLQ